ncbi:MAG: DUF1080 domain-containing protein, partial [Planctomycetaceae bacterium]
MRFFTKTVSLFLVYGLLGLLVSEVRGQQSGFADGRYPKDEWVSLFNGKDLTGWTPKIRYCELGENFENTFRVEDGLLKVRYDGPGYKQYGERFGHLFFKDSFSNYRFRVEYRFV